MLLNSFFTVCRGLTLGSLIAGSQGDRTKNVGVVDSEYIFHLGIQTLGGSSHPTKKVLHFIYVSLRQWKYKEKLNMIVFLFYTLWLTIRYQGRFADSYPLVTLLSDPQVCLLFNLFPCPGIIFRGTIEGKNLTVVILFFLVHQNLRLGFTDSMMACLFFLFLLLPETRFFNRYPSRGETGYDLAIYNVLHKCNILRDPNRTWTSLKLWCVQMADPKAIDEGARDLQEEVEQGGGRRQGLVWPFYQGLGGGHGRIRKEEESEAPAQPSGVNTACLYVLVGSVRLWPTKQKSSVLHTCKL